MHDEPALDYCPTTPDAVDGTSLYDASSNIDDLTLALVNFSQVPPLESQQAICCCCGSAECKATKNWLDLKEKLEKRLHLSAEVGSALLQRHEAYYVRRHESDVHTSNHVSEDLSLESDVHVEVGSRVAELIKDNAILEKRLTQALLNIEITEASHKTVLQDLEEAQASVTRLTAHQVRTVKIDSRLAAALQENDDLRQERDCQAQKTKSAEARIASLKHRTDKLQTEVRRLQADLELRRLQRLESSESLLQDVRSRLKGLHHTQSSLAIPEDPEIMELLESLVSDNEILKADNEELHALLTESREDLQAIQSSQVEEHVAFAPPVRVDTPSRNSRTGSGPSSLARDSLLNSTKRPSSTEPRTRRIVEPLTPETSQRPLSPVESMVPSETRYTSVSGLQPQYLPSHFSFDVDEHGLDHSNAVQTDRWLGLHPTAHLKPFLNEHASSSSHDGRSDSSSVFDDPPTHLSALLEHMMSLLLRMSQADALTLTNRLKRQHLRGAYVKHLSRTTVSNILSEIAQLRAQYYLLLEDEKVTVSYTRRDLRGLFRFFKDAFEELGQLRVMLNDIIIEPSIAQKVSEIALDPAKAEAAERKASGPDSSWMAPFSKLFGSSLTGADTHPAPRTRPRSVSRGCENIRQPRPVPKLAPALAASTTTVNVEFSGAGVGKPVTSTFSAHPTNDFDPASRANTVPRVPTSGGSNARSVMGIFAGAPHPGDAADQWVVLPRTPRRVRSTHFKPPPSGIAIIDGVAVHKTQLSREVDAVTDSESNLDRDEAKDTPGPLLERTLRRRGLSESSIHSTYMSQAEHSAAAEHSARGSVLQTLGRTVRNFSIAASQTVSGSLTSPPPPTSRMPEGTVAGVREVLEAPKPRRAVSPMFSSLIPNLGLTSWAAAGAALENSRPGSRAMYYGSVRDEPVMP